MHTGRYARGRTRKQRAWPIPACAIVLFLISGMHPPSAQEPVSPLDPPPQAPAVKRELGEKLFHDRRLSRDARVSCADCHRLDRGGDDGRTRAPGFDGRLLDFNTPTIFNAAANFRLNWRGNFRTLEELTESVLRDARLMNGTWDVVLPALREDADYTRLFAAAYGGPPQPERVVDALVTFQHTLTTPDAPFDRYLRGASDAISAEAARGYQLFKTYGCVACHQGANVGGNLFQKFGIFYDPFARHSALTQADLGRYAITGRDGDRHVFRVPSLRNVAVTAPYFHDGRAASLAEAVEIMARSQLGRSIPAADIDAIVAFLGTLTGTYRGRPVGAAPDHAP